MGHQDNNRGKSVSIEHQTRTRVRTVGDVGATVAVLEVHEGVAIPWRILGACFYSRLGVNVLRRVSDKCRSRPV